MLGEVGTGTVEEAPRVPALVADAGAGADPAIDALRTEESRPRLAHEPALDGLRGLAVVAVFLFHLERLDGGFLGVDLFFVLSGFLITSLLVVEHGSRGRIDLGRFWARRARRLLPALLGLLVGVAVLLLAFTPEDQRARFRGDALATLGYVANWHRMSIDLGYWDIFEQPSPLDHTWSLAIEEQFYVVWPLVAVAVLTLSFGLGRGLRRQARGGGHSDGPGGGSLGDVSSPPDARPATPPGRVDRKRLLGWLALLGAALSFGVLALTYSPVETDRAYYGTDTRIGATLLGAALALFSIRSAGSASVARRPAGGAATQDGSGDDRPAGEMSPLRSVWAALSFRGASAARAREASWAPGAPNGDRHSSVPANRAAEIAAQGGADHPPISDGLPTLDGGSVPSNEAGATVATSDAADPQRGDPRSTGPATQPPAAGPDGQHRRERGAAAWMQVAGAVGLAWMVWSAVTVDGLSPWYYRGGLVVFAVAAVVVIRAVTGAGSRGLLARVVGWAPLRGLGVISYGVYLWHWPVAVYLTPERARVDGWVLDGARVAVTLAVALASFWLVEQPIRRGALRGRALYAASGGALAVTLAAVLVATAGTRSGPAAADDAALGFGPVPVEGSDNPYLVYPSDIPPDAVRVLMVGDSGVYFLGPMMAAEGEGAGVAVASSAPYWCNVALPEGLMRFSDGEIMDRGNCQAERRAVLRDLVEEFRPDAVVYYLANASGPGEVRVDGAWTHDCEPAYDEYLTRALQEDVDLLSADGARVVLATSPDTNVMTEDADQRTDCRNATYRRVAASRPDRTTVVDMNAYVAQQRTAGVEMFQDLVHLSPEGGRLVSQWLFPQLRALVAAPPAPLP